MLVRQDREITIVIKNEEADAFLQELDYALRLRTLPKKDRKYGIKLEMIEVLAISLGNFLDNKVGE